MAKTNELATIDSNAIAEIERVASESGLASIQNLGQWLVAFQWPRLFTDCDLSLRRRWSHMPWR